LVLLSTSIALLAGCGGGGGRSTTAPVLSGQQVQGEGYSFRAPEDWTAKTTPRSATVTGEDGALVSVTVLPLLAAYRPALYPRVVVELDRVAKTLAGKLGGELTSSRTVTAAGGKAREYEIEHKGVVDRITFVLRRMREYQLTCRWQKANGEPAACDQLAGSFTFR
jgi:hypothetical protein